MINRHWLFCSFLLLSLTGPGYGAQTALEAATKIAGTYQGEWFMYGWKNGSAVEKLRWTDSLTAKDPILLKDRAQVSVTDRMTYPDGSTRTTDFVEGYLVRPDGTAGDRFYELMGTLVSFQRLAKDDWSFRTSADAWELAFLGFDPKTVISASHTTVKSSTYDGFSDTDHVTRITTVQWKAPAGTKPSVQFVSMKGFHTRTGP